jgi:hypothetical protein
LSAAAADPVEENHCALTYISVEKQASGRQAQACGVLKAQHIQ